MKFCLKQICNCKSATETFAMLNTIYGDVSMECTACFKWHERLKDDRQSIDDDKRPERPSTSTDDPHVDKINTLMRANRRLTIRELAEEWNISWVLLRDFDRKIEDAPRCCDICATPDDRRPKNQSRPRLSGTA